MEFKCELDTENFDRFYAIKAAEMTERQKERLPQNVLKRAFTLRGKLSPKKITFPQILYVLFTALNYEWYIVLRDEEKAAGIEDFLKYAKEQKLRNYTEDHANELISKGQFVIGNKDLTDYLGYINYLCGSNAMTYSLRLKNTRPSKYPNFEKEANYIVNLISNYELNKPMMSKKKVIHGAEFHTLRYLYDGKEKKLSELYLSIYKGCFGCNKKQFLAAFRKLVSLGYLKRFGATVNATARITDLGRNAVNEIIHKYILP